MKLVKTDIHAITPEGKEQINQIINFVKENVENGLLTEKIKSIYKSEFSYCGVYQKTIVIPKGTVCVGALIKIPHTLIIVGECLTNINDKMVLVKGTKVYKCDSGRQSLFYAQEDTTITLIFHTNEMDIKECRKIFTDDYNLIKEF